MPYEGMALPKEYDFSCAPVVSHDGQVLRPDYVKFSEFYCTSCGYVATPTHGVTMNYLDRLVNAWNQTSECPCCGAENAWGWRAIDELGVTWADLSNQNLAGDRSHSDGSGAAASGADLTHA